MNRTYEIQCLPATPDTALDIDHAIESASSPDKKRFVDLAREQGVLLIAVAEWNLEFGKSIRRCAPP